MTSERERFHYVFEERQAPAEMFYGPLWPAPDLIVADRRVWRLIMASVLTDSDMRIVRRAGRPVPIRSARYRAIGTSQGPPCGHPLAFGVDGPALRSPRGPRSWPSRCTVCTPIPCDACAHPAHLGGCQSTLGVDVDQWTDEERARARCLCDTYIGQVP
jgi:hypothetical protein